jgi:GntR family transcriptional regulator
MTQQALSSIEPVKGQQHRPLYAMVRDELLRLIRRGALPPGSQLPSERELTERLGVSRVILREALRVLEEDNVLVRRHGVGTFVNRPYPVITSELQLNFGLTEIIEQNGLRAGASHVQLHRAAADEAVADALGLRRGTRVTYVERVRTADERPVAYTLDYLSEAVRALVEPLGEEGLRRQALYQVIEDAGVHIARGLARIAPAKAGYQVASMLDINPDSVMLRIEQVDYDANEQPLMFSREYHLRDAFEFRVQRTRKPARRQR